LAVAHPTALMLVFTAVFSRLVGVRSDGHPYPLFAFAALLPWTFLSTSTTLAMRSLVDNVELVTKVWFPRETLPTAAVLASLFDLLVAFGLLVLLMIGYGALPGWSVLWIVPLALVQLALTLGVALFVSAVNVRYRDVKYIVPLGLQVWLYLSPVIYSARAVPEAWRALYGINPMVGLIQGYRAVLLEGAAPPAGDLATSAVGALLALALGWLYFRRVEAHFADVI
jgi:lipopolysaccharide transport system permease protein